MSALIAGSLCRNVIDVPFVMVNVLTNWLKLPVSDSCSSYFASDCRLPVQVTGYDLTDGETGGALITGLVATQLTVKFAVLLLTLPQLFDTFTHTCAGPGVLTTNELSTGPVAPAMGWVSLPCAPTNH